MIARLTGTIERLSIGTICIDVNGVGYLVQVPADVWDTLPAGGDTTVYISTYVREDRFELYGFADDASRRLFEALIAQSGIGPRLGLELCAVPRGILLQAVAENDAALLSNIKGIGKKTAEKLLIELKNLTERQPDIFGSTVSDAAAMSIDQDAVAALQNLGYDTPTIMKTLSKLPDSCTTTEERVAAALRSL